MELAVRQGADRYVAAGAYRALETQLRADATLADIPLVVLSAFDPRTRMLPFLFYDRRMVPAGGRLIAGALHQAGFHRVRSVFQLWNPHFRPSRARLEGRPLQMLLVSSMQLHSRRAYLAIRDAWTLGAERPLLIVGGPKAIYEPYHFWATPAPGPRVAPDVAVTGEAYVLLDLLNVLRQHRGRGDTMRAAFERARRAGALETVPGLVYLAPGADLRAPVLVDTGVQRLVPDLDELPHEALGLSLLEPPHRGAGLGPRPIPEADVRRFVLIVSVLMTQGCKFTCPYCPIPAAQQQSWRFRSPEAVVAAFREVYERYRIKYFFGVDDNFFNRREAAEQILSAMAGATVAGRPFGERLRFATEATQVDTYKHRDLLPLARAAGLHSLWLGIEDLTASLINKGQKPAVTLELFRLMQAHKICPMAMLMYHAGQPRYTRGSLYGLVNQVRFLRQAGAVSVQCFVHTPAPGTREYETTYASGQVIARVGRYPIPEAQIDGNHVVVSGGERPWRRQLTLLRAYGAFYNPGNLLRALTRDATPLRRRRIGFQCVGMLATLWTGLKLLPYAVRLLTGALKYHTAPPPLYPVPVRSPAGAVPRHPASPPPPGPAWRPAAGRGASPLRAERLPAVSAGTRDAGAP